MGYTTKFRGQTSDRELQKAVSQPLKFLQFFICATFFRLISFNGAHPTALVINFRHSKEVTVPVAVQNVKTIVAKAEVRVVDEEGVVEAGARDAGLPSLLTAAGAAAAGLGGWAAEFKLAASRLEAATEVGTAVTSTLCACALRPDMLYEAVAC